MILPLPQDCDNQPPYILPLRLPQVRSADACLAATLIVPPGGAVWMGDVARGSSMRARQDNLFEHRGKTPGIPMGEGLSTGGGSASGLNTGGGPTTAAEAGYNTDGGPAPAAGAWTIELVLTCNVACFFTLERRLRECGEELAQLLNRADGRLLTGQDSRPGTGEDVYASTGEGNSPSAPKRGRGAGECAFGGGVGTIAASQAREQSTLDGEAVLQDKRYKRPLECPAALARVGVACGDVEQGWGQPYSPAPDGAGSAAAANGPYPPSALADGPLLHSSPCSEAPAHMRGMGQGMPSQGTQRPPRTLADGAPLHADATRFVNHSALCGGREEARQRYLRSAAARFPADPSHPRPASGEAWPHQCSEQAATAELADLCAWEEGVPVAQGELLPGWDDGGEADQVLPVAVAMPVPSSS
jgi:hypothetical protein